MGDFTPVPLGRLLRRARLEYERRRAIFDLPERKFYRPPAAGRPTPAADSAPLDLSVRVSGQRAGNPMGLAAGPHTQLAQNIALGWLAGARVFELKTVQANDRITVSRPCIDIATVGYNTEWSQELSLDESLREYVKASMLVEALGAGDWGSGAGDWRPGSEAPDDFVFEASVGYDLEGIRSRAVVSWLESMRDAGAIVDELRRQISSEFGGLRDFPFRTRIAAGLTLSTFHGTPAGEIERIGEFLIGELGFHTAIKVNPPMLGRARLDAMLRGVLGYEEVTVNPAVFERGLSFEEAAGIVRRLQPLADGRGVTVGVKCGNTLEVFNRGTFLKERVQYLSGQPLHALHAALALQWREAFGPALPIAFAGGVDAGNAADCVAAGLVPVTVCTDLLRAGGYGRLPRYLGNIEARMRSAGARTIPEFVAREASGTGAGEDAVVRNARALAARALSDPRYRAAGNRKPPRKLGTHLWLWDCLSCSKCIPVCPNDAVFEMEVEPFVGEVPVIEVDAGGWRETGRRLYSATKATQIAIFADACNACGNCDVFCPEDGGPHLQKPRFFGRVDAWRRAAPRAGFVLAREDGAFVLRGRFPDGECALSLAPGSDRADFETGGAQLSVAWPSLEILDATRTEIDRPVLRLRQAESLPPAAQEAASRVANPESRMPDPESRVANPESRIPNPGSGAASPVPVDLSPCMTLRLLLGALLNPARIHFVSAELLE